MLLCAISFLCCNVSPTSIEESCQTYNQSQQPILKQDANSNSPVPGFVSPTNQGQITQFSQSASSSPAFNHPGFISQPISGFNFSSVGPPTKPALSTSNQNISQNIPASVPNPSSINNSNSSPYHPKFQQQLQINDNAPPLIPSSQFKQSIINGPPLSSPPMSQPLPQQLTSSSYSPMTNKPVNSNIASGPINPIASQSQSGFPPSSLPPRSFTSQPSMPYTRPPLTGPPRNSPLFGPSMNVPPTSSGQPIDLVGPPRSIGLNGPTGNIPGQSVGPPQSVGPVSGLPSGPTSLPHLSTKPPLGTHILNQQYPGQQNNGPLGLSQPTPLSTGPGPMTSTTYSGSSGLPMGPQMQPQIQRLPQMGQSANASLGPPGGLNGPPRSNIQSRYPQMPSSGYTNHQQPQVQPQGGKQLPSPYNPQGITQQMGQLSVTKQGFDQLWGHQMVDLMQTRHILPEYPEDPPEIRLGHQFADAPNCSPEIFRCTINRIPDTNSLLQKCRLPLGILIHPFKDLNHLPVIQCTTIVRCRACRTYINPFVYFVDSKRWKCNLCYRVNDLPEEFQYDPVSKSYGEPTRRPEIKSATIEFIAPGEYMLRPPQPAVYLFLFDVSQIARDSGYLQVVCDTLKEKLDELPGDARTQVGFICYDAHVHYYLMGEGLMRPKEMTVLDIDDVFLPSPESLLVNLGECRDLVKELLTVLPGRYSTPGVPVSALGAALLAGYKLMAPTGGRITVFQTCLPNIGPGALQSREDPNARSAKEVAHLNPASDFYKRLALDCSGAQVAVDLFLLSSQYCDLATLSGMSKFSAGTVYHIPLFRAARNWQAEQLTRMLTRYLTRKIGFEAVMRVRCTRGISIHTFHGNFFVRSTDLLSLPNVSPDAGFGMQLTIEESLSDLQQVCFQAALLYTSSKGERRIRVHTLALPIASNLTEVLHAADQQCIIGLLSKMAVDRCASASMPEAREALMNVAVDALSAHRLAQNLPAGNVSSALYAPAALRLLPLYLLALLKRAGAEPAGGQREQRAVRARRAAPAAALPAGLTQAGECTLYAHRLAQNLPGQREQRTVRARRAAPAAALPAGLTQAGECTLYAHRLAQNLPAGNVSSALYAPAALRLLPLYLLALLKRAGAEPAGGQREQRAVRARRAAPAAALPAGLTQAGECTLYAHRLAQNLPAGNVSSALYAPAALRLLPLYLLALLKRAGAEPAGGQREQRAVRARRAAPAAALPAGLTQAGECTLYAHRLAQNLPAGNVSSALYAPAALRLLPLYLLALLKRAGAEPAGGQREQRAVRARRAAPAAALPAGLTQAGECTLYAHRLAQYLPAGNVSSALYAPAALRLLPLYLLALLKRAGAEPAGGQREQRAVRARRAAPAAALPAGLTQAGECTLYAHRLAQNLPAGNVSSALYAPAALRLLPLYLLALLKRAGAEPAGGQREQRAVRARRAAPAAALPAGLTQAGECTLYAHRLAQNLPAGNVSSALYAPAALRLLPLYLLALLKRAGAEPAGGQREQRAVRARRAAPAAALPAGLTQAGECTLYAHRLAQNLPAGNVSSALYAPAALRLLPLYLLALLKRAGAEPAGGQREQRAVRARRAAPAAALPAGLTQAGECTLYAHRLAQNLLAGNVSSALYAPAALRLLPLYLLALLKRKAFRTGTSTRLDERVADMCALKSLPLPQLMRLVYPELYALHDLAEHAPRLEDEDDDPTPDPPRLHLSAERISSNGAYLLDDGETMIIYVCCNVSVAFLSETFGVAAFSQLADEARSLPRLDTAGSRLLHALLDRLNDERPYPASLLVLRDNSPTRQQFTERLVDDRVESAFSYYEFLQHVKNQVK
ncbi:unnamed protein product [Parnassius apollo]|uniref:(apollo) hypothetical protein n=1 Tax=Parnassius apollo TaxID=110799 RepID=A0A8S3YAZ7_PARAO|nr:unnamed protein product [Parnassius apollo]